jgi:hypothetical protein
MLQTTGIAVTAGIPVVSSASATETVDIPILESPDGVEKWETVPRAWDEHRKHTRRVRQRVTDAYLNRPGVKEVSVVGGDDSIGWKGRLKIRVEVDSESNHPSLPSAVEGVDVEVGEYRESKAVGCYNDSVYDPIPGGVVGTVEGSGTITCVVSHGSTGEKGLLTAAHLADRCTDDIVGDEFYQEDLGGTNVGNISVANSAKDWMISDIQSRDWKDYIRLENSNEVTVKGWVNNNGLDSYVGSKTVEKMGKSTGHTTGELNKISISGTDTNCTNWEGEGVETKCAVAGGDSGGPIYIISNDKVYLVAILQQGQWEKKFNSTCNGNVIYNRGQGYQFIEFVNSSDYTLPAT